jgi:WS/DGAT/MGAT family acyltransferase
MPAPSLVDRMFLAAESAGLPQNAAFLGIFAKPDDAGEDFVSRLGADLGRVRTFTAPLNYQLTQPWLGPLSPSYRVLEDDEIDLDFHLRLHVLPAPGDERQLGVLISRLHSTPLDLNRPAWEFHLIDGLDQGRFAMYYKVHHALMDGVAGSRRLQEMLSADPSDATLRPMWAVGAGDGEPTPSAGLRQRVRDVGGGLKTVAGLSKVAAGMVRDRGPGTDADLASPFAVPSSPLNGRVGTGRRVATQTFDYDRFRAVAKAAQVTHNDVFLAVCSGGLRRYLTELDALPDRSLIAGTPVNVRTEKAATNAFTMTVMRLATDIDDPLERLQAIHRSSTLAKQRLKEMHPDVVSNYAALFMGPFIGANLVGLGGRTPPPYNVSISNVPGPVEPQFFGGARLLGAYPLSVLYHGVGLFIAAMTVSGRVGLGFVGDEESLPHLQHLAVYTGEAFDELQAAVVPV